ncbi:MAG: hypothetical protein JOZ72_02025 [Alphaproteobacteria bacterium]|nr:hypothetical protein [Alphaproteobacteria bacterium]
MADMDNQQITSPEVRPTPTVSRVCEDRTLVELVYDAAKRTTGLAVSRFNGLWNIEREVRIETGELLVPYSPKNNLIANECVLLPSAPAESFTKEELVADIEAFLYRYADLSPLFAKIASYYVLLTWVHDAFNEVPYLRLRGDYGTGKTRALMTIGSLCYKAFSASGASTTSPIFHTLDAFGGTLLFDEADLPYSDARADIVKILNNGTVRGMPVLRTVVNRHKEFNPKAFKVFGPKIVAMRGSFDDRALESRFFTEETGRSSLRADIPIQLPDAMKAEALALRNRLLHFRFCNLFSIQADPTALMEGVEPRLNQTAAPLLSLIDDRALRAEIQQAFADAHQATLAERRETVEARLAIAVADEFASAKGANVNLKDVAERFNREHGAEYGGPRSSRWVGHIVRTRLHLATRKSVGVYTIPATEKSKVEALVARLQA